MNLTEHLLKNNPNFRYNPETGCYTPVLRVEAPFFKLVPPPNKNNITIKKLPKGIFPPNTVKYKAMEETIQDALEMQKVFDDNLVLAKQEALNREWERKYNEIMQKHLDENIMIPVDVIELTSEELELIRLALYEVRRNADVIETILKNK